MGDRLRLAVVGVGRMGKFHARHIQELSRSGVPCDLVATVDRFEDAASRIASQLQPDQAEPIRPYKNTDLLAKDGIADAAVIASRTEDHAADATAMIEGGMRVLLEKPLTESVESAHRFAHYVEADAERRRAVMLAFMRRFDEPLMCVKRIVEEGRIGRPFKIVTALEDGGPPPPGYKSPGILTDMGVHLADEAMWLLGTRPQIVKGFGANLFGHKIGDVDEDFDDALLQMWFPGELAGQLVVSRNHVAGYRNEVWVFGEAGVCHGGLFQEDPSQVTVEAYNNEGGRTQVIEKQIFDMGRPDGDAPEFIWRFGKAYKAELAYFVGQVLSGGEFSVTHRAGLNAIEVVATGTRSLTAREDALRVEYLLPI